MADPVAIHRAAALGAAGERLQALEQEAKYEVIRCDGRISAYATAAGKLGKHLEVAVDQLIGLSLKEASAVRDQLKHTIGIIDNLHTAQLNLRVHAAGRVSGVSAAMAMLTELYTAECRAAEQVAEYESGERKGRPAGAKPKPGKAKTKRRAAQAAPKAEA